MKKMTKYISLLAAAIVCGSTVSAYGQTASPAQQAQQPPQQSEQSAATATRYEQREQPIDTAAAISYYRAEFSGSAAGRNGKKQKYRKDGQLILKDRFLPTSRRIDREINRNKYVFKGETMLGLTASYGTFDTEDADMFPVFENIDVKGTVATVNPFIGYFYRDNNCIGVRFGYSHLKGGLENLGINLGPLNDLGLSIPNIDLASDRFSAGLFHRSYISLDDRGRFGVFGEFEGMFSWGDNHFSFSSGDTMKKTVSDNMNLKLTFSPGVAVYAFPNVCMTLSFGLGGFTYNYIRQYDDLGHQTGERHFSKLNFRLNIADIRLGMNVHIWNHKKGAKQNIR